MTETKGPARLSGKHFPALDGLRGMAIAIVLLHHFVFLLPTGSFASNFVGRVLYFGWTGVDLFFVLSGFLIYRNSRRHEGVQPIRFSSFYARRVLRIFPLYYAVLSIIVILDRAFYRPWFDQTMAIRPDQIYYFFYLDNWLILLKDSWHGNIIGHFWSLAVEEQFYLVWPLCVWMVPTRRILQLAFAGCALAFIIRLVLVAAYGPSQSIVQNTFARMDTLLAGAACAMIVRSPALSWRLSPLSGPSDRSVRPGADLDRVCSGRTLGRALHANGGLFAVGRRLLCAPSASLFRAGPSLRRIIGLFSSGPMKTIGKYSYGIYVLHVPILTVANLLFGQIITESHNPAKQWAFVAALFGLSFVAAEASYTLFERRFLALKEHFDPRFEFEETLSGVQVP